MSPRGYPDYFGQSIFPKYGTPHRIYNDGDNAPASVKTAIITALGKGKSYGGSIYCYSVWDNRDCIVTLEIDGITTFEMDFEEMTRRAIFDGAGSTVWLSKYVWDTDRLITSLRISPDITFEQSLVLSITPTVSGPVLYYNDFSWVEVT